MVSIPGANHETDDSLYNSRIIKNYVEYTKRFYPEVDLDTILDHASITKYELEDQGHWFSQSQIDRFQELLRQKTRDRDIPRKVGRYAAFSKTSGTLRQYALGLITPASAYRMLEKFTSTLSRASTFKTRQLASNRMEVTVVPKAGVNEKLYQCDNRVGWLESVAKVFTKNYAKVEHPVCIHKGGSLCQYTVTWEKTRSFMWRRMRNYLIFLALPLCAAFYFSIPSGVWPTAILPFISLVLGISLYAEHLEKQEIARNIEAKGDAARLLHDEIDLRYNHAQVVKEIGQATSMFLDIEKLLKSVMEAMEKRLDFDRGGIWLANKEKTHLVYHIGYGYDPEVAELLKNTNFHLDNPNSKGVAVQAFRQQRPFLVNDIAEIDKDLSHDSLEFINRIGAKSFICAPIVYERESLGVLFVDNLKSKRPLSQSDMSLLMGIAPQIAISIHNAMSYEALQESKEREKNVRKLFEKYVPAAVIKRYVGSGDVDLFRGEESSITAVFLDIRSFTARAETMEAGDVVSFLNDYFDKCSTIISKEHGHVNKFTGDGFLALFGAPEPLENNVTMAFDAACAIIELSKGYTLGGETMEIGIGLHTGKAILGNIGSRNKMEYTAIGDTVNTAARLQEFTKRFHKLPIVMSRDSWQELVGHPYHHRIRNLGKQKIRGKKVRLEAFGFNPSKTQSHSLRDGATGFLPLQRIKGV